MLYEITVKLSENQKRNLSRAFHQRETIFLRLASNALSRSDTLYDPSNIVKRLNKNGRLNKGMDIKLVKTNIRKQMGGNLLTSILSMGRALAPTIGKTLGLSALAGLASEGASQLVKKISGGNVLMDFASELNKRVHNRRRPRSNKLADRILASAYAALKLFLLPLVFH